MTQVINRHLPEFGIVLFVLFLIAISPAVALQATDNPGYFVIDSVPRDAQVILNDIYRGNTPLTIPVSPNSVPEHTIIVIKSGYYPWTRTFPANPAPGDQIRVLATLEPSTSFGTLYVTSQPSGALVTVDGAKGQQAPWTYQDLSAGSHVVRAFLSGYQPFITAVNIPPGGSVSVNAILPTLTEVGSLQVKSTPGGADIYIDGFYSGTTSTTIGNLAAGDHFAVLRYAGYEEWTGPIEIKPNQVSFIDATLTVASQDPNGYIVVSSSPPGGSVYLDGVYQGETHASNDLDLTGIPPGSHKIEIRLDNYQTYVTQVEVHAGKTSAVSAILAPATNPQKSGNIQISSNPSGANVMLDNIFRGITPLTLASIDSGSHALLLRMPGYQDYQTTINVSPGQTVHVEASLSPQTRAGSHALGLITALGIFMVIWTIKS